MMKPGHRSQINERKPNKSIDTKQHKRVLFVSMERNDSLKIPKRIGFSPDAEEEAIIRAGRQKHGLKKAQDVISMALRRFAEHENFEFNEARAS